MYKSTRILSIAVNKISKFRTFFGDTLQAEIKEGYSNGWPGMCAPQSRFPLIFKVPTFSGEK